MYNFVWIHFENYMERFLYNGVIIHKKYQVPKYTMERDIMKLWVKWDLKKQKYKGPIFNKNCDHSAFKNKPNKQIV